MNEFKAIEATVYDIILPTSIREVVIGILLQHGFSTFQEIDGDEQQTVYRVWTSPNLTIAEIANWFPDMPLSVQPHRIDQSIERSSTRRTISIGKFRLVSKIEAKLASNEICLLDGVGFGWGEHPTTVLGLKHLQRYLPNDLNGAKCLDFGAGTGVLTFAAARCGAPHIDAVEVDDATIFTLEKNCLANQVEDRISIHRDLSNCVGEYDLVLANLYLDVLLPSLPKLVNRLKPGARLWMSGFTVDLSDEILRLASTLGLKHADTEIQDDWIGITLTYAQKNRGKI